MKLLNIATLIVLLTVVDHSSSHVLATTMTSEYKTGHETKYETIPIPKQEGEGDTIAIAPLQPTLLRGAKKAVYQFLSDGDSEELSCVSSGEVCRTNSDCCSNVCGFDLQIHVMVCFNSLQIQRHIN